VKQADLVVGRDYAFSTFGRSDVRYAARVTVLTAPASGKVDVRVVDPGRMPPWQERVSLAKGKKAQIATAMILCPWDEYGARADAQVRDEAEAKAERERRREARLAAESPNPDRPVEDKYEPDLHRWDPLREDDGAAVLAKAMGTSVLHLHRPIAPAEAVDLLGDLPPMVRRDLVAALADAPPRRPYGETRPATGSVRDVFGRAASLVTEVVSSRGSGHDLPSPDALFRPYDAEFLRAIVDFARGQGQDFTLPFVPRLPAWATASLEGEWAQTLTVLGWVRVALAGTEGRKLHCLGCSRTRSRDLDADLRTVRTMPWWELALTPSGSECSVCGGPALLHGTELAHFVAAADVWEIRGRDGIEPWQIAAVGRLLAATTSTRMRQGQFDATLSARVWDALSVDAPGVEGWSAYYLLIGMSFKTKDLSSEEVDAARILAVRRLNQFLAVLPKSHRLPDLPPGADLSLVAERYRMLNAAHEEQVIELPRALFSLEGAYDY
jgi:hypothetical protein